MIFMNTLFRKRFLNFPACSIVLMNSCDMLEDKVIENLIANQRHVEAQYWCGNSFGKSFAATLEKLNSYLDTSKGISQGDTTSWTQFSWTRTTYTILIRNLSFELFLGKINEDFVSVSVAFSGLSSWCFFTFFMIINHRLQSNVLFIEHVLSLFALPQ